LDATKGIEYFAGDLPEAEQKLVWATHYAPGADLFQQQNLREVARSSMPSWFVVANQDHTVHPELQRALAKCMNATVVEAESSHVPMLSQPEVVLGAIRKAAASI
jgi:pimeloyl-ACP methyl ester carboxylesterase